MKLKLIISSFLFCTIVLSAQKKSLNISDFAGWNRIENRQVSNDGKFVSFEVNKQKGDGILVVYHVETQKNDTIPYGSDSRFSAASDYMVFNLKVPEDTLRKHKLAKTSKDKMPKETFGVYNLHTGNLSTFENVKFYRMPEANGNWLVFLQEIKEEKKDSADVEKPETDKTKKGKSSGKKKNYMLTVWEPVKDTKYTFSRVDSFAIARKGSQVAFISKENDSTRLRSLVLFHPVSQETDTILVDSLAIDRLTFDEPGNQLAYLCSADTSSARNYSLYYYGLKKKKLLMAVDSLTAGMPAGWAPSRNGNLSFSRDGSKLFFGTAPAVRVEIKDSVPDEDKPKLDVWSHTDPTIQPYQLKQAGRKKKQTYQAVYLAGTKQFVQLGDTVAESIRLFNYDNAELALGIDNQPYQKLITWSSRSLSDYYLVDLKSGKKTLLLKGKNNLDLSPATRYALYYDFADSVYYSVDLKKMKTTALTRNLPVMFCDELNDVPGDPEPYGIAGWTENDAYVLIYDRFDIWKIDPSGKEPAVNLTNGREVRVRYRYENLNEDINYVPDNEDVLLSSFNEKTNAEGYFSLNITKPGSKKKLIGGDFKLARISKAKNAGVVVWSTQTVREFPDVKISDLSFAEAKKISDANPQQEQFIWPVVEEVSWNSFAGDSLRGLLYKPENFNPQRKYPVMVYFYEKSFDTEHRYNYPQPSRSIISIPFYVSNEYLVFVPDIAYGTGYPGRNAYDAVVSGVRKLTETMPFVDAEHIGVQGQSWGGYQIAYLVTRTDIFAAAMAGAPVSNMTSAYGGIRWGTGMSRMFQYEQTQSRIGGTLWERPLLYIENSPLFMAPNVKTPLLMMANDNDGAVPWYQGIEFFMALYRLNKPVWLLNYNGMEHNLESQYWANRIDLSTRMFGFFNHYLKGMPAPEWMVKGVPAVDKGKKLGY